MNLSYRLIQSLAGSAAALACAAVVTAQPLTWQMEQIYSNADGTLQFVVMHEYSNKNGQNGLRNSQFSSLHIEAGHAHDPGTVTTFILPNDLPSSNTADRRFVIASQGFARLGILTPDYVMEDGLIPIGAGTLSFFLNSTTLYDVVSYTKLPSDGLNAIFRNGSTKPNLAINFAGQTASVGSGTPPPPPPAVTALAVEYYYAAWDYYFMTAFPDEIAALDGGAFGGVWQRTGQTFNVWPQGSSTSSATCRFFSTSFAPKSSHFYTPFASECADVKNNPDWQFESIAFYIQLADANGNCSGGTVPLYRLYNNGKGGAPNHRYTTSQAIFDAMIAAGWVFEGNGNTRVFACVPALAVS